MAEYELTGECSKCGDCCAVGMAPRMAVSRKNLIGIERNGEMEYMVYCDFVHLVDGKFKCKLLEEYAKAETLDLTEPLDSSVITEEIRVKITSEVDGTPINEKQVSLCCQTIDFPYGIDLRSHAKTSEYDSSVDRLHELCPNCTFQIVEIEE